MVCKDSSLSFINTIIAETVYYSFIWVWSKPTTNFILCKVILKLHWKHEFFTLKWLLISILSFLPWKLNYLYHLSYQKLAALGIISHVNTESYHLFLREENFCKVSNSKYFMLWCLWCNLWMATVVWKHQETVNKRVRKKTLFAQSQAVIPTVG